MTVPLEAKMLNAGLNQWAPQVSMDEWIDTHLYGQSRETMLARYVILPCMCGESFCQGWAAIRYDVWGMRRHLTELQDAIHNVPTGDSDD